MTIALAAMAASTAAHAQHMEGYMQCSANSDVAPEQRLRICTEVIKAAQVPSHNLAIAYDRRGKLYRDKSDYQRAIADFDEAIKLDPEFIEAFTDRGIAYFRQGQVDRAIADYDQAIKLRYFDVAALTSRGQAYQSKGDYDGAIKDYNVIISMYPARVSASAFRERGDAYRAKGEYDRAIQDYDEAIKANPRSSDAMANRLLAIKAKSTPAPVARGNVDAERSTGPDDQAIAALTRTIAIDPKNILAYFERARAYQDKALSDFDAYVNEGHYEDLAIQDYDEVIHLNPDFDMAFNNRGTAFMALLQYDRALKDFDEAVRLAPYKSMYFRNRAAALRAAGKYAQAIADYRKALTLNIDETGKKQIEAELKELGLPQ
jgi:tetratricopeptide (TPR) repeat protein